MLGKKSKKLCIVCSLLLTTSLFAGCNKTTVSEKVNNNKSSISDNEENSSNAQEVFLNLNEDIDGEQMVSVIGELASEKYDGRLTGTEGNRLATEYIKSQFEEIGLDTLEGMDGYLQYYNQKVPYLKELPKINVINKDGEVVKELKFREDFNVRVTEGFKMSGTVNGEMIYLKTKQEFKKNKESLEGKIVIVPYNIFYDREVHDFLASGESKALGVIKEYSNRNGEDITFKKSVYLAEGNYQYRNEGIPMIVDADIAATKTLIEESEKGNLVELSYECYVEEKTIANVIGVIPGTEKSMKDDYIIISGHFDHLGSNYDGTYNPGASDNASGIASMLEIARSIKSNNIHPKRPILFIAFNGEENGLYGSKHFAEHTGLDMKKVIMLNIDMIAHKSDGPLYISAIEYSELFKEIVQIAKDMDISYKKNLKVTYSDHTYIEEFGGQAVTFVEIEQAEYHTPDDNIDVIKEEDLKQVVELVLRYLSDKAF